jgi:hypothetical protein
MELREACVCFPTSPDMDETNQGCRRIISGDPLVDLSDGLIMELI